MAKLLKKTKKIQTEKTGFKKFKKRLKFQTNKLIWKLFKGIRTKQQGLTVLKKACKGTGATVLPWKIYYSIPTYEQFKADLSNPTTGRILIRTDSKKINSKMRVSKWADMPREMPFEIKDNGIIKAFKWMNSTAREHKEKAFIVQKVPELKEYNKNIRINVYWIKNNMYLSVDSGRTHENTNIFRKIGSDKNFFMKIPSKKILEASERMNKALESKELSGKILKVLERLVEYARINQVPQFEASAVTYKNNPKTPEFYDFLLGKGLADWPGERL